AARGDAGAQAPFCFVAVTSGRAHERRKLLIVEQVATVAQHHWHVVGAIAQAKRIVEHTQCFSKRSSLSKWTDNNQSFPCACHRTRTLNAQSRCRARRNGNEIPAVERTCSANIERRQMRANEAHFAQQCGKLTSRLLPF